MKRKNSSEIATSKHEDSHSADLKVEKMEVCNSDSNSGESLYEIRLNEFVRKDEISDFDLRALVVRCSACGRQINHQIGKEVKKHRKLKVITCKECYEFYGSSEFSQDESGYNYCTWCGNGGKLIVCDYCPNGFCSACIRRNFGRAEISETTKEGWKCYVCNKTRLKPKIKFCDLILSFRTKNTLKKEKKSVPNSAIISETWLQSAFDESEVACKTFCLKMSKLRSIGVGKKKSLKHIVKKVEDLIKVHKTALKNITVSMNDNYMSHIEQQQAAELKVKENIETVDISNDNENSKQSFSDCVIEDLVNESKTKLTNDVLSVTQSEDKSRAERMQAKLKLLQSSSDSDNNVTELPASKIIDNEKLVANTNLKSNGKITTNNDNDIIEISDTPEKNSEKDSNSANKVKRKIDFNFSDLSNSDFEISKPDVDCLVEEVDKQIESEKSDDQFKIDPGNDPKLKQIPKVELIRCDHLLKEGAITMIISENSDMEEKLDKLVDSLCKFPRNKKKSKVPKAKRRSGPLKSKVPAKQLLLESSSSISLSSDEDEDQKKIQLKNFPKKLPSKESKSEKSDDEDSDSSLASNSDSEEDKKKKKKSKPKKKAESDSSDDFVPVKKKKYDKLLRAPLLSDDDDDDDDNDGGDEKKTKGKKERKAPRKRKAASSDESKKSKSTGASSSDESDTKGKKPSRKRKRIKKLGSSSEEDEKNQNKDTPGKGRKNIRKILSEKKIAMSTKEAQAEEKERKRRIAERQKLYNKIEETIPESNVKVIRKMVLETDPDSKEEIVEIHPDLVCKLKPHQVDGVQFMWDCTIESVKDLNKPGSGCILAHCMGLGKTLQVITFLHTCLNNKIINKVIKRAMIICPYNTALNWANEFDFWLEDIEGDIQIHQLATVKNNLERLDILKYWFEDGGVIILSYDMFRRLAADRIPKLKKKDKEKLVEYLLEPGPDIVVCDEGHILKNEKSAISVATSKLETQRRIVLTGTPLQNNLKEYHCMVSFVKPNLLGTVVEFRNRFVNPIINGQYEDSNEYDVRLMKRRIHILHKLLDGCVQRCDYSALTKFLPPKHEFVISVKLSETQVKMYECFLDKISTAKQDAKIAGRTLFADFNNLRNIWTHPYICHTAHERAAFRKFLKDDGEADDDFINDGEVTEPESSYSSGTDSEKSVHEIDDDDDNTNKTYKTRSRAKKNSDEEDDDNEDSEPESKQWYHEFISDADKYNIELSGKMKLLLEILKECEKVGDKILLFAQSLLTLDMIEDTLSYSASESSQKEKEEDKDILGSWIKGLDYFRMDGTTSADFRKSYIDIFNNPNNERARLFLISTRAGSLGTNLVGANRVIIFDTSWNPSHDVQAIFRVYRFGQVKPVYIYRLLAQGTMEEKIYDRQVTKISLSYRVVDEQQIDRHFSAADLAELYSFDRNSTKQRPTPMVPKDRLLAELLIRHKEWIVTYHEHDSLLQNETETDLTEEERKAAWLEYENEKEGRATSFDSNTFINEFDTNTLTNEPDFSQEYEGKKIPELKTIIEYLYERLKKTVPDITKNQLEFKKRLLASVYAIRQAFQEKHVKILRMKQEYCTRGSVPNAINKYMDELSQILKQTADYITRLSGAITSEQTKLQKMQQEQQQQMFTGAAGFQNPTMFQAPLPNMGRFNLPQMVNTTRPVSFSQMNPLQKAALNQFMLKKMQAQFQTASNSIATGPVITEVDDSSPNDKNASSSSNTSTIISAPSTSTVTIKEIT